jgi:hypothetical protein
VLFLLVTGLLLIAVEILARSDLVQRHVPLQAYGTNHIQFETEVRNLKAYTASGVMPNCFILGNSQSLRAIEPETLAMAYHAGDRGDLRCYNFSVVGTNNATTLLLARILIDQFHPDLLIVGTNFLDYTESREDLRDARFLDNDWIGYQLGRFSLTGWLLEYSYAYRLLTLVSYAAPGGLNFAEIDKEMRKWDGQLSALGHGDSDRIEPVNEIPKPGFVDNFLEQFGNFSVSGSNLSSLEAVIALARESGAQVLIVEMPYHGSLLELPGEDGEIHPAMRDLDAFIQVVNADIEAIADRQGVPYWEAGRVAIFSDDSWHDRYHLNRSGSQIFTRWLAEEFSRAVLNGQLSGSFSGE